VLATDTIVGIYCYHYIAAVSTQRHCPSRTWCLRRGKRLCRGANSILRRVSKLPDESGRHALTLTLTLPLTLTLSLCRPFTDMA